jgi:hypothetical protein
MFGEKNYLDTFHYAAQKVKKKRKKDNENANSVPLF